ncbi:septal ring lytic transglycosylase RlpA family protein [Kordiimonas aestuarii]|uniref:septal ring lytic transglycosylase RlpA family protein n=1 Tax=Kordiimonas aestuarii TaxID=1005925 RepID=UPI0021D0FE2F|nr:septal ring lytic transglycosylase RlpA family protein [Kordiimonas aestuarii]
MRYILLLILLLTAACSSGSREVGPRGRMPHDGELPVGDQGVARKVGNPYKVAGVWYHPKEDPYYDEVGYASWYGPDFHGKRTANGEQYNMNSLTAAHKTLPLPTFVKVTNLENGRSIVLRVNDRGPFVKSRIIDVSRRGAQLLGFDKQGVTKVRVQALDENGKIVKPKGNNQTYAGGTSAGNHYIQVGAYSQRENAEIQLKRLRRSGHDAQLDKTDSNGKSLWRVRLGPFKEKLLAEQKLDRVVADGFYEARIFSDSVR